MMLYCFMWLLCLSASAEITAVYQQPKHISLECSILGCHSSIDDFAGMYLFKDGEEVLYYNKSPKPEDQIVPRQRYGDRLQKKGCLQDNIITISNVTVADSGVYTCVYVKFPRHDLKCNVYKIEIKEVPQPPAELPGTSAQESTKNTSCPSLSYIIIITSAVSVLLTLIFTLLMILMVKRWVGRRTLTTRTEPGVPNEYVYEVMTTNGFRPVSGNFQSPCA